ncbi:MAG TPA: FAD-dependent oxidoreductase [Mycobacteriales bacterium]|nr:FAD-dependent oxidoreductase [Mycobacteriales bacterium]
MRIVVVGGGVIGLTCAHRLVRAGHAVEVWTRDAVEDTTSAVAAALWYPYRALPEGPVTRWAAATYDMLSILAVRPETAVRLVRGRELSRVPLPDPWWAAAVPRLGRVPAAQLPPGYADGYEFAAPVVHMPVYLRWLIDELAAAGVPLRHRELADLDPARQAADVVVNATGLAARALAGDDELTGLRGQVVRVADPGLTRWTLDEGHPAGLVYVVPRGTDVVCGGTDELADSGDRGEPDPKVAEAILERCREVVPELVGMPVLGHAVGVRPVRTAVRVERDGAVVHCYGHGGAGVTLSWGCADEVVRLVGG